LQYGYSSNFDNIDSNNSAVANRKIFLQKTYSGISADVGFEYILLSDENKEEDGDYAYDTKIGVAVMDVGSNKFRHGGNSRLAIAGRAGIADTLIENKFSTVTTLQNFNDSLATIANSFTQLSGDFFIYQPTRLMINVDQHIVHNFFVNAELTIPLLSIVAKNTLYLKDMNLLAVTPRWEIQSWALIFLCF
jgi:hypothetical protein